MLLKMMLCYQLPKEACVSGRCVPMFLALLRLTIVISIWNPEGIWGFHRHNLGRMIKFLHKGWGTSVGRLIRLKEQGFSSVWYCYLPVL